MQIFPIMSVADKRNIVFVFDLNGTLLKRVHENKKEYLEIRASDGRVPGCGDLIYVREYLTDLISFLHKNNVKYIFWTTAMEHNGIHLVNAVVNKGMNKAIDFLYHASSTPLPNTYKRQKNMNLIARKHSVPVENIFLIDDEEIKCVPTSAHIKIAEYDPRNTKDTALLSLIDELSEKLNI